MVLFQTFELTVHYGKEAKTGGCGFAKALHPGTPRRGQDLVPYMHFPAATAQVDHVTRLQAESRKVPSTGL